jgi:putative heme-binding domain-containing protein
MMFLPNKLPCFMNKDQTFVTLLALAAALFMALSIGIAYALVSLTPEIRVVELPAAETLTVASNTQPAGEQANPGPWLQVSQNNNAAAADRKQAVLELARLSGSDLEEGRQTFQKHCIACHRIGSEGAELAPELTDVGKRLKREEIVESIVHPSAVVEDKYKTTMVLTLDGDVITGLKVDESESTVKIFDSKDYHEIALDDIDEMATKEQSSMPERLADAMTPSEFINLVEFLANQTESPGTRN